MSCRCTDADDTVNLKLCFKRFFNALGNGLDLTAVVAVGKLLDDDHIRLIDTYNEVMLSVGEHILQHLDRRNIGAVDLTHEKQCSRNIGHKVQLLGSDIDITGQNVIGNDAL